ncbi:hypothetical protein EV359DRAFT_51523 [Lentinula novae-zelandiae]|nr:hypothetical protein EV359DRAFT_51523 [Lentinula novae-zelandiae]
MIFYRQVGVLNGRSEAGHQKLASEMLHNVVIGPVGVENAYFAAFIKGFLLPGATGFNLADVSVTYMDIFTSTIRDFESLDIRIVCSLGNQFLDELAEALSVAGAHFAGKTFEDIIKDFLISIGAPCPQLLAVTKDRFSPEVKASLSGLQSPTFRMCLMCWAVTGAPRVLRDGEPMQIILVDDNDTSYLPHGLTSYLIQLLKDTFNPDAEIKNAQVAIHHWLLIQMLDSAGTYNMA